MPRLAVWMVRTSLLHLGVGFTAGMLMLMNKGIPFEPFIWRLLPVHVEMILLGWTMQLAMGVAFWILPRFSTGARYGSERLGWAAYTLLNGGLALFFIATLTNTAWLLLAGRLLEFAAVICFAVMIFPRVKALSLTPG